jgi:hypothetical protein
LTVTANVRYALSNRSIHPEDVALIRVVESSNGLILLHTIHGYLCPKNLNHVFLTKNFFFLLWFVAQQYLHGKIYQLMMKRLSTNRIWIKQIFSNVPHVVDLDKLLINVLLQFRLQKELE